MASGLTVAELRELLKEMPASMDNFLVVVSEDEEGTQFDTVSLVDVGWYREHLGDRLFSGEAQLADDTWEETFGRATKSYVTNQDDPDGPKLNTDKFDHPAVCLWP